MVTAEINHTVYRPAVGLTRRQLLIGVAAAPVALLIPVSAATAASDTTLSALSADSSRRISEV